MPSANAAGEAIVTSRSLWRTAYMVLITILALAALALAWPDLRYPDVLTLLVFLALAIAAEWQAVALPGGAYVVYGMMVALPAAALFTPTAGAAIGALGALVVRLLRIIRRQRSPAILVTAFAAAQLFLCYLLAGAAYRALVPNTEGAGFWTIVLAYFLALLIFKAANGLLVDQMYNRLRGLYSRRRFISTLASEWAIHLLTAPPGLLMILTYRYYGLYGVVLSFAPVLIATYALVRYVQGYNLNQLLNQRADQLTQILQISETLRTDLDLDLLLARIAQAVRDSLGFNVVLLSLYEEPEEVFVRRASAGIPPEEFARLQAQRVPRDDITRFVDERFRSGRCYLVPHNVTLPGPDYSYTPPQLEPAGSDAWQPRDLLLVPLVGRQGELIGVISVDDPVDGRRPQPEALRALEIFANQAAQAIENARHYREQRQRLVSLEEANRLTQQAQAELAQHSRKLEDMVAQRTRELQERSEQLEVALERAWEADRLKTEFLASMSHELRTPLNSIIGFSRVILNGIDGPIEDLQRTDLTAIHNSGVHLLGLINDILDLSKIEAGHMELRKESVDIGPVVKGVLDTCTPLIQDKPVEMVAQISPEVPPVYADPTRVRQIILNLVSNAIKYTDRGVITVSAHSQDSEVMVSIGDTGIGIQPQDLSKVFEPFRQVGKAVERRAAGTGLGLAISRRFVEMHGGRIWVESEPGQGSTFSFTLPAMASACPIATPAAPGPALAPAGRTVLVVDDDPDVISLFRRYLEEQGYQIIGAQDAVEALRLAWEEHPYAITLDINMPEEDGWTVLRALKEDKATQEIPVIICSVIQDEDTGFSLGAADYLTKPISQETLLASLVRLHRTVRRIIVVDDDPVVLAAMSNILQETGRYQVIPLATGEEGLQAVQEQFPDLIILDLLLPGIDGFEVLARLKADRRTRAIPIVVITAKELTAEEEDHLKGQMDALLHKGVFTTADLLADIARVLREG
jgi:signal transduction histidine kinase/DNA-binding response OmpR family regulator